MRTLFSAPETLVCSFIQTRFNDYWFHSLKTCRNSWDVQASVRPELHRATSSQSVETLAYRSMRICKRFIESPFRFKILFWDGEPIRLSRADTQRGALCTSHRLTGSKFSALHDLGDIYVPRFHYQLQPIIPSHVLELPFGTWSFCCTCTILHLTQFSKHTITYTSRQPFV